MKSAIARFVNHGRSFLPRSSVPAIVATRSRIARRKPAAWADAQQQMRFVVGDDQPDEVIDRVAEAYLRRSIWRGEARWHPDLVSHQQILGVERLHALLGNGTGLVVNFVHHGDYEGISPSLADAGIPNHNLATSEVWDPGAPIWMKQQARVVDGHKDVTLLDVAVGSAGIKKVLSEGSVVAIATDQPGHTAVRFLGRDLQLSSGAARVAKDTDVPVAVVVSQPDPDNPGGCGMFKVADVLHPADFESVEALLSVMLSRHEEAFLAWPEAAEHPLRMLNRELVKPPSSQGPSTKPEAGQGPGEPGR